MKKLEVYDPPMCCSTGICGTEVDPALVRFAALLRQLGAAGVQVERHNLGQEPVAFVRNPAVKALLDTEGMEALPVLFQDGTLRMKGRYPTDAERSEWLLAAGAEGKPA